MTQSGFFYFKPSNLVPEIQVLDRVVANGTKAKRQHGVEQYESGIIRSQANNG